MDPVLLLVLGGVGIALAGIAIGVVIGRVTGRARKAAELEEELEQTKEAFEDYRTEVVQQFADTAGKFRRLNESYSDLHQQLATSASVLCADRAGDVLLALPDSAGTPAVAEHDNEATIDAASEPVEAETAIVEEVVDESPSAAPEGAADAVPEAADSMSSDVTDSVAEVDLPEQDLDEVERSDVSEDISESASPADKRTSA